MHTDTILDLRGIDKVTRILVAAAYELRGDDMYGAERILNGAACVHLDEVYTLQDFADELIDLMGDSDNPWLDEAIGHLEGLARMDTGEVYFSAGHEPYGLTR